jgi:hypothetical protein
VPTASIVRDLMMEVVSTSETSVGIILHDTASQKTRNITCLILACCGIRVDDSCHVKQERYCNNRSEEGTLQLL